MYFLFCTHDRAFGDGDIKLWLSEVMYQRMKNQMDNPKTRSIQMFEQYSNRNEHEPEWKDDTEEVSVEPFHGFPWLVLQSLSLLTQVLHMDPK